MYIGDSKERSCSKLVRSLIDTFYLDSISLIRQWTMIVVCDNAPVHAALERVTEDEDFAGVRYLAAARALQRTAQPD